jgi:hypothetical protein
MLKRNGYSKETEKFALEKVNARPAIRKSSNQGQKSKKKLKPCMKTTKKMNY